HASWADAIHGARAERATPARRGISPPRDGESNGQRLAQREWTPARTERSPRSACRDRRRREFRAAPALPAVRRRPVPGRRAIENDVSRRARVSAAIIRVPY